MRSISCRACGRSLQAQPCLSHVEKAVAGTPCVSKNIRGHMEYACAYIYIHTLLVIIYCINIVITINLHNKIYNVHVLYI